LGLHVVKEAESNIKLRGRTSVMDRGGSAGLHFACDTIGNDLIIPGCETEGGINGLPKFSSETANVGGCLGVTAN
jgi:hypothetical protein